jgi:hypothetical protein
MKANVFVIFLGCLLFSTCYKQDSIYHYVESNLPKVENLTLSVTNGCIDMPSKVSKNDVSELLRVGHIWGTNSSLKFADNKDSKFKENKQVSQLLPFNFASKICSADVEGDKPLYITSYAINEIGISYGSTIQVFPDIEFSKLPQLLEEQNMDKKINPGERVKLKFFIRNKNPVNSLNTKVESLSYSVNELVSVEPRLNIGFSPSNKIAFGGEFSFDLTIVTAANASGTIEIIANIISDSNTDKKISTSIKIN